MMNGMIGDTNGGVCLIKQYQYYTFIQEKTCPCIENVTGITKNIPMGIYLKVYANTNDNYSLNTSDPNIALVVPSITGFVETYINDIITTGYTSYDDSGFENRVIYEYPTDTYYYIENTLNASNCTLITNQMFAIINYDTGELYNGSGDYWYVELNDCGDPTGNKYVYMSDINPSSETYGQIESILMCN